MFQLCCLFVCLFFQKKKTRKRRQQQQVSKWGRIITTNDHHMFQPRPVPHENENTRGLPPWMAPAGRGSLSKNRGPGGATKGCLGVPPSPEKRVAFAELGITLTPLVN